MDQILKFLTLRNCAFGACGACVLLLLCVGIKFLTSVIGFVENSYYWDNHLLAAFIQIFQYGLEALAYIVLGVFFGIYAKNQPKE